MCVPPPAARHRRVHPARLHARLSPLLAPQAVFYVAAHVGVIYDFRAEKQHLLLGHVRAARRPPPPPPPLRAARAFASSPPHAQCNAITACAVSQDKRWIVTADAGADSMVVVWDASTHAPVRSLFSPHPHGVLALALSPDATRIATLSAPAPGASGPGAQALALWEWAGEREAPLVSADLPTHDVHRHVVFNPANPSELVSTGPERVVFWQVEGAGDGAELAFFAPPVSARQLGAPVAAFTVSTFLPGTAQAVSATVSGEVVLWDAQPSAVDEGRAGDKAAMKLVRLVKDDGSSLPGFTGPTAVPIEALALAGSYLVVGDGDGSVRFFDFGLRLLAWFEDVHAGPVTSISFAAPSAAAAAATTTALAPATGDALTAKGVHEAQTPGGPLAVPDFIIGTRRALLVGLNASLFDKLTAAERAGTVLVQGLDGPVPALAVHPDPRRPVFVAATSTGAVSLWDWAERALLMVRLMDARHVAPTCAAVDPSGRFVALGTAQGAVHLLDATHLTDAQAPLKDAGGAVTHLAFSHDGRFLAVGDAGRYVSLYRFLRTVVDETEAGTKKEWQLEEGEARVMRETEAWVFLGRAQAHSQRVSGLSFGVGDEHHVSEDAYEAEDRARPTALGATAGARPPLLVSLGEDRRVVHYDVLASSVTRGVVITARTKLEQSAVPTACVWYPGEARATAAAAAAAAVAAPAAASGAGGAAETRSGKPGSAGVARGSAGAGGGDAAPAGGHASVRERLFVTANDEYKLKLWNASNDAIRRTVLGPTFGGPVAQLFALPAAAAPVVHASPSAAALPGAGAGASSGPVETAVPDLLVYTCTERVAGLLLLPLDGNPHKSMGLVAHPGPIAAAAPSSDGSHLLTAGGPDGTVALWSVSVSAMHALEHEGGKEPFLEMLEGGAAGAFYQEICDFFSYAQIRSEGEDNTRKRRSGINLPLTELPNLVRALGYYPSEAEVEALVNEVRYARYAEGGRTQEFVDLGTAVRLFVNHRPVLGVGRAALGHALRLLRRDAASRDATVEEDVSEALRAARMTRTDATAKKGAAHAQAIAAARAAAALLADDAATVLPWRSLKQALCTHGEAMTEDQLAASMTTLLAGRDVPTMLGVQGLTHTVLGFEDGAAAAAAVAALGSTGAPRVDA
jgi:WD40 repeat protein